MILKKSYAIVNSVKGSIQEICQINDALCPNLLVFGDNWVVVSGDNICLYDPLGRLVPNCHFYIQATSKSAAIVEMAVFGYYLLIIKESGIYVYNLIDFTKMQEIPFEKDMIFRDIAIDQAHVYLAMDSMSGFRKELRSTIIYLKEISPDEQIKKLLNELKIEEAQKVFSYQCPCIMENYEIEKENFNCEAAWTLFKSFNFEYAIEFFLHINYDPNELLAVIPEFYTKQYTTLKDIARSRNSEEQINEGIQTIIFLIEEKRKYFTDNFNIAKDVKKSITFIYSNYPINPTLLNEKYTLEQIFEIIDNSLLKLYVKQKRIKDLQTFIETTKILKHNKEEIENYLNSKLEKDYIAQAALAFLANKQGKYIDALTLWRNKISEAPQEIKELACKETTKLLVNQIKDKDVVFEFAKTVLVMNVDEGLKIFTENKSLAQSLTDDDIFHYFDSLEAYQPELKGKCLEFLVNKKDSEERFHTLLGMHYATKIKEELKKDGKQNIEKSTNEIIIEIRKKLSQFLHKSEFYNSQSILESIQGLSMFEEEILLFSKQKMHAEALNSLVEIGKQSNDFSAAEKYCLEQSEALFATLLEKIIALYYEAQGKFIMMKSDSSTNPLELTATEKLLENYKAYCKSFLMKYATNEKMDCEKTLRILPDEWLVQESDNDEDSLLDFLQLMLNDRLGKDINYEIARNMGDMEKLHLANEFIKLQQAYVCIQSENKCQVCNEKLGTGKNFSIYPNGIVTHGHCAKDPKICPITKFNFSKKIYP